MRYFFRNDLGVNEYRKMATGRILVLIDGTKESLYSVDFALKYFNEGGNKIVGISLDSEPEDMSYSGGRAATPSELSNYNLGAIRNKTVRDELSNILIDVTAVLESRFVLKKIHVDDQASLESEVKYSDLLITTQAGYDLLPWNEDSLDSDMKACCCPKVVIDQPIHEIENVVLLNDGSQESVYAIKNFCRFYDDTCKNKEVTLLNYMTDDQYDSDATSDLKILSSYLQTHCKNLAFISYKSESEGYLQKLLQTNKETIVAGPESLMLVPDSLFTYAKKLFIGKA